MKRNEKKVPEFDEIIFENRNKTYGAYDIRKHYNATASLSILGGIAFAAILTTALSFAVEDGKASTVPEGIIIVVVDPMIPESIVPPKLPPPPPAPKTITSLPPVVTADTNEITPFIPTTEDININTQNGNVNDTITYTEPIDPVIPAENKVFTVVEEMPEFPGGIPALLRFIGKNLVYPEQASNINIQGRVSLKFVVNTDGSVDRIEVLRGVDPLLDNEAIRVVKTLPKFKPGRQGGIAVPVWFSLPVVFKLSNN